MGGLMSRASKLGQQIRSNFAGTITTGTIVDIDNFEERSMVEVELADGSLVNAMAWVQADLQPGNDVVLGRVNDSEHALYAIVAANAPAVGLDPLDRDPVPDFILWSGETFRPKNLPNAVGGIKLIREMREVVQLNFSSYTELRAQLTFSIAPTAGRVAYWLYGYDIDDKHLTSPGFMLKIGTNWKSSDLREWRSVFDMMAVGAMGEWIDDREEAIFVLALERLTSNARASDTGRISQCRIHFDSLIDAGTLDFAASGHMQIELDYDEDEINLSGQSDMVIDQYWIDAVGTMTLDAVVLGPHDHSPYTGD